MMRNIDELIRQTDNWLELTVRFVVDVHGSRGIKDVVI